jgi:hypothetical protein
LGHDAVDFQQLETALTSIHRKFEFLQRHSRSKTGLFELALRLSRLTAIISVHPRHLLASAFELSFRQHDREQSPVIVTPRATETVLYRWGFLLLLAAPFREALFAVALPQRFGEAQSVRFGVGRDRAVVLDQGFGLFDDLAFRHGGGFGLRGGFQRLRTAQLFQPAFGFVSLTVQADSAAAQTQDPGQGHLGMGRLAQGFAGLQAAGDNTSGKAQFGLGAGSIGAERGRGGYPRGIHVAACACEQEEGDLMKDRLQQRFRKVGEGHWVPA